MLLFLKICAFIACCLLVLEITSYITHSITKKDMWYRLGNYFWYALAMTGVITIVSAVMHFIFKQINMDTSQIIVSALVILFCTLFLFVIPSDEEDDEEEEKQTTIILYILYICII